MEGTFEHDRRSFLTCLAALPMIGGATTASREGQDVLILALGRELGALELMLRPDVDHPEELWDRRFELVREIEAAPATTFEGMLVKARAFKALYRDEEIEMDTVDMTGATDLKLLLSIVKCMLASGAAAIGGAA